MMGEECRLEVFESRVLSDQFKKNKTAAACGTQRGEKKCMQSFR